MGTKVDIRNGLLLLRNEVATTNQDRAARYALNAVRVGWGGARTAAQIPLPEEQPFIIDLGFVSPHINIQGVLDLVPGSAVTTTGDAVSNHTEYTFPTWYELNEFCDLNRYNEGDEPILSDNGRNVAGDITVEMKLNNGYSVTWLGAIRTYQFDWDSNQTPGYVGFNISFITQFPKLINRATEVTD